MSWSVGEQGCELDADGSSSGAWTPDTSLRGDPSFEPASLPPEVRCWYEELWRVLTDDARAQYFTERAASRDIYYYSREVNNFLVSLVTAFRVTGDLELLDEIDRHAQHMRSTLDDTWQGRASREPGSSDGYLNWIWDRDWSDSHRGRDINEIDEMRAHSQLAQLAYVYSLNADLDSPNGADYAERADFWLDYLRNHFEAKWRERNDVPWPKFPFIERPHLHETLEFARYHHYMYELTGEQPYAEEARKLSRVSYENFEEVESPSGPALVTPRSVLSMGGSQNYLIPSTYFRHVVATAVDLHFAGVEPWSDYQVMEMLARTVAEFVLDEKGDGFARDAGGGEARGGIRPTDEDEWNRMNSAVYNISPFSLLAAWDDTGEIAEVATAVHLHRGQKEWYVHAPSALLLDAALNGESVAARED